MRSKLIAIYIIASAIVWGLVMIGCSLKLKGTGCYEDISFILYGGTVVHLIFLNSLLWIPLRKGGQEKDENKTEH